jgi:triosephosphate isomerase (TIM)
MNNQISWPIIVGNWKMQLGIAESIALTKELVSYCQALKTSMAVVVCPSYVALPLVRDIVDDGPVQLGAQDLFWAERGAYTGEISPSMLQELGVEYCIIGHSSRRALGETDAEVGRKTLSALTHGIRPIICVGESAAERALGRQQEVVRKQLESAFRSSPPPTKNQLVYIAYEPIWAISPNDAADPGEAELMRRYIRRTLVDFFPAELVESSFLVLYGGSVDSENVANYIAPDKFKGALVGKASLSAASFCSLIQTVSGSFPGA